MDRRHILAEIRRTAEANGGTPLGLDAFFRETGIKSSDWYGKHWARWGEALNEAGFDSNKMNAAYPDEEVLEKLVNLVRDLGRFPSSGDLRLKASNDPSFPSHNVFSRLGSKSQLAGRAAEFCANHHAYSDLAHLCVPIIPPRQAPPDPNEPEAEIGFVYLIKSGKFYKIGRTNAFGRREREITLQLPDKSQTIHTIRTDDPVGIEAYWHKRFEGKRKNGEWFELSTSDVKAFTRRKFM